MENTNQTTFRYCYLFSWELYFAGINGRDLAKKYVKNIKNTLKTLKNTFLRVFNYAIF